MTYLRSLMSLILMIAFTFHPAQAGTNAIAQTVAKKMSSYKTFGELAQALEQESTPFSKELWQYYKSQGLLEEKIPNLRIKNNEFILDVEKNIKLALNNEEIEVTWGKKKKVFGDISSLNEAIKELEAMPQVTGFNFSHLFINEAHAQGFIGLVPLAVLLALIVLGVYGGFSSGKIKQKVQALIKTCNETQDSGMARIEDLVETYNTISEINQTKCLTERHTACPYISSALSCYRELIKSDQSVNKDGRDSGKEIHFRPQDNTFVIKSKASAM